MLGGCAQTSDLLGSSQLAEAPAQTQDGGAEPAKDGQSPQSELQKATAYWGQEYAKRPTDLKPALSYARNLKALGEKERALNVLQQAAVFHDGDPELASEYGRLALEFDQLSVASRLLEVADNPSSPDWKVISARGTVLAKQGDYKGSIPFYERALTFAPNQPSVVNNLAMAYAMSGEAKKAEDMLRQAADSSGSSPKVRQNLALVLGLQGRYDEAKAEGSKAIASDSASSNSDYIKQMVKLDPVKSPDAMPVSAVATAADTPASFKTTVARAQPVPSAAPVKTIATALKPAPADAPLDPEGGWNTAVANAAENPATALKGSSR
jgi:Flp pilus assembly protein TadD